MRKIFAQRTKIHAIDNGTIYDIPARVIHLGRDIRNGKLGQVKDVIVITRTLEPTKDGRTENIVGYQFGQGGREVAILMLEDTKLDLLGR